MKIYMKVCHPERSEGSSKKWLMPGDNNSQNIYPLTLDLVQRAKSLVSDVQIDLNEKLSFENE